MKTLKQWNKSNKDLDIFLWNTPCEIDEDLHNYFWEIVAPQYVDSTFTQCWEAQKYEYWINFYSHLCV